MKNTSVRNLAISYSSFHYQDICQAGMGKNIMMDGTDIPAEQEKKNLKANL